MEVVVFLSFYTLTPEAVNGIVIRIAHSTEPHKMDVLMQSLLYLTA